MAAAPGIPCQTPACKERGEKEQGPERAAAYTLTRFQVYGKRKYAVMAGFQRLRDHSRIWQPNIVLSKPNIALSQPNIMAEYRIIISKYRTIVAEKRIIIAK